MQSSANFRCRLLLAVIVTTVPFFAVAETGSARPAAGRSRRRETRCCETLVCSLATATAGGRGPGCV